MASSRGITLPSLVTLLFLFFSTLCTFLLPKLSYSFLCLQPRGNPILSCVPCSFLPPSPEAHATVLNILLPKCQCHSWSGKISKLSTPKFTCQQELTSFPHACFYSQYPMMKRAGYQVAALVWLKTTATVFSDSWPHQTLILLLCLLLVN